MLSNILKFEIPSETIKNIDEIFKMLFETSSLLMNQVEWFIILLYPISVISPSLKWSFSGLSV